MTGPCDLYFCTEPGCVDFFKDVKAIEMHMISGQHNVPTVASSMDHVKQCYANKMKMSKPNALSTVSGQLMSSEKKTTLWPLFMDGVQLPQVYSYFEEGVYFLPLSSQKFLVLILLTSEVHTFKWVRSKIRKNIFENLSWGRKSGVTRLSKGNFPESLSLTVVLTIIPQV